MHTLPESSVNHADAGPAATASRAAFRRGRWLVRIVVAGSGAIWFQNALHKLPWYSTHGETSVLGGGVVMSLLCWSALRAGRIGGGILILVYGTLFLGCVAGGVDALCEWLFPATSNFQFRVGLTGPGEELYAAYSSIAADAWIAFSLWVLTCSKSARSYRETRRQQVAAQEANAFEWPPAGRS